jgi:YVTN family beta-propeller protein
MRCLWTACVLLLAAVPTDQSVSHMLAVTPDGNRAFIANIGSGSVTVVDLEAGKKLRDVKTGDGAEGIAITPDGERALVSCARAGEVAMFDVPAREEIGRTKLDLSALPGSERRLFGDRFGQSPVPIGLVIAPDGKRAWVAATQSDVVVALDLESFSGAGLLRAGKEPDGMAYSPIEQEGTKDRQPGR